VSASLRSMEKRFKELPKDRKELTRLALELADKCRASAGARSSLYQQIHSYVETGRSAAANTHSLINVSYAELDRTASHLFSPTDLRFDIDYQLDYPLLELERGRVAARHVTRIWERANTDVKFAQGVFEALKYGACILKQWVEQDGEERTPTYQSALVMPWNFGVYREDNNDIDKQYALCETIPLSLPEVWRRIHHLPDADALFRRIKQNAVRSSGNDDYGAFLRQVVSVSPINTSGVDSPRPAPGGIVDFSGQGTMGSASAVTDVEMVKMFELWVQDGDDYTTIQIIEPDILIAPLFKHSNLMLPGLKSCLHPYQVIQPNIVAGYFWGRSEMIDIMPIQDWLSVSADDAKRLLGLQVDKIIGVEGDAIPDEEYAQMRMAGVINVPQGSHIKDLTPNFPPELLPMIEMQLRMIERVSGFDNMLSGRGEPGVRSGMQSSSMMKAASPRLKDRSLIVERQCATAADLTLSLAQAKEGYNYWTDPDRPGETSFLLADLPEDRRITVDSHSTSPVFADDHQQIMIYGHKMGLVDDVSAIETLPFPNKDTLVRRHKEGQMKKAHQLEELKKTDPEAWAKAVSGRGSRR
jgi:hypothetical protein